ncbi:MAG: 50S ribosomal protein L11 methyltransferase, partial [Flavobacteriaceae bacterium]|nr:50S ribosomal protein L11 methyltransferase [Flavobacteriaceae bacterium]
VIIANINRNILLADMKYYSECLDKNDTLLLSGFYREDISNIDKAAIANGFKRDKIIDRNNWVAARYYKN